MKKGLTDRLMRFLDLDLDFFLNDNPYCGGCDGGRLGSEYKPWSASKVRHFLEGRCGLSADAPVQGRTVASHDGVFDFWRTLVESGCLRVPFDVIHVDAHPDLLVVGGLYLTSEFLHVDSERVLAALKSKHVRPGNYLTFAIARGWIGSLVWVPPRNYLKGLPTRDSYTRSGLIQSNKRKGVGYPTLGSPAIERGPGVSFKILSSHEFKTTETFDYIALSRSPNFTPPESDELIPIIEGYMIQI